MQRLAGQPVLVGDLDPDLGVGGVAFFGPQSSQQGVGEARRVEAALLGGDDHPAGRLVPAERLAVLRVVPGLEGERHVEALAPAVELERVVRAARLGAGAQRNTAGSRDDLLEVERLEDQSGAVLLHDLVQARATEVGPRAREAVVAGNFGHRIGMLMAPKNLAALAALARRELEQLRYPAANWVLPRPGPDGKPMLDALIVGGGMLGQTALFALRREGVTNVRCLDKAPRGLEGPWKTFARMDILRSPKHLTGPDLGVATLTYRAWHEAKFGAEHWEKLHKIDRVEWANYLLWVRETAALPLENEIEVERLELGDGFVRAVTKSETIHARKAVLAMGREGSGAPRWPKFETFDPEKRGANVLHSADDIDFHALRNQRVAVLGAGASAFDNAASALEAGATEVVMYARRRQLPQVNKSKWASFPGFLHGYAALDDARRWRFYTYIFSEQVPPPYESVLRCEKHAGFSIRFGEAWTDITPGKRVRISTSKDSAEFDAAIIATGFGVDLTDRPEVASFRDAIEVWENRVSKAEVAKFPEEARFPYLGDAFQLRGKHPDMNRVHVFNWGVTMSHGALSGDIPGIEIGARRLSQGIVRDLFLEDADEYWRLVQKHNEDEMKPTRWFVPLVDRRSD